MPATDTSTTTADAQALVDFVRERDVACPLCGYNLRGLTTPRCPECGRELRLSVGLVEPRQGAWLMCQIAMTALAGIGVLAWVSLLRHGWPGSAPSGNRVLFNLCFLCFLGAPAVALAVFLLRRRYLRLAAQKRWALGIATAVFAACVIVVMFISDR